MLCDVAFSHWRVATAGTLASVVSFFPVLQHRMAAPPRRQNRSTTDRSALPAGSSARRRHVLTMLSIGIVGCGYWGAKHIRSLQEIGLDHLIACDADTERLANIRRR